MRISPVWRPRGPRLARDHWRNEIAKLDPDTEYEQISRIAAQHEFPWDLQQALSFALFRTYAVPSIGRLLFETNEFTGNVQRRHDDTVLILDAIATDGMASQDGRTAIRRLNKMHGSYDISNDDMRYVLSTFVVTPSRWIGLYGWRKGLPAEQLAAVRYYQRLGKLMGIKDIPANFEEFSDLMDAYEAEHFAYDDGARAVADSTLNLLASFYPMFPSSIVRAFSLSLMEPHLLEAFGYRRPAAPVVFLSRGALKLRARLVRHLPPRREPKRAQDIREVKSYKDGFLVENLGTFPTGCPVAHAGGTQKNADNGA